MLHSRMQLLSNKTQGDTRRVRHAGRFRNLWNKADISLRSNNLWRATRSRQLHKIRNSSERTSAKIATRFSFRTLISKLDWIVQTKCVHWMPNRLESDFKQHTLKDFAHRNACPFTHTPNRCHCPCRFVRLCTSQLLCEKFFLEQQLYTTTQQQETTDYTLDTVRYST